MSQQTEQMEFQAEARQLLDLVIHSLYKHKEIFLRELISNASDALDKVRFEALTRPELLGEDDRLHIRLEPDPEQGTLSIHDNGIGMNRDEIVANIGTIARSGTREFLNTLRQSEKQEGGLPEMIGQFGVGFYSAFMVADEVVVETLRAGEEQGYRWRSRGEGGYSIEEIDRKERGTSVTLHLKKPTQDEDSPDFSTEWALRETVKNYSDFVAHPIEMEIEREEGEGEEKKKVQRVEVLNSMKPLWTRSPTEIKADEYAEFYRHLSHDWEAPAETIHFRAEGTLEYTALLYIPGHKPISMLDPHRNKAHLSLYVKRVFIMGDCEELLPIWLRFVSGLVDSSDLPLNVSRETLQHTRQMKPIKKHLVTRTLSTLKKILEDERERYEKIWADFGPILKEGICVEEDDNKFKIGEICLFRSTRGDDLISLDEYIEKMPFKQKEIYYLAGQDLAALKASPHLEGFKTRGLEVLLLTDPVDEFAFDRLGEFDGKKVKSIERGEVELEDDEEKEAREEKEKEHKPLLEAVKEALGERVGGVRFSNRLTDSAAVLVSGEDGMSPHMKRMLKEARQDVPDAARTLELNPEHPMTGRLEQLRESESGDRFADYCELLFCQAQLAEGTPIQDPVRFNKLVTELMVEGS